MEKLQAENLENMFCSLCINSVCDANCQVIEALKDVLEIVLPKLNLDERDKHFICEACSIKLFDAFNFKLTCIETEDIVFPHIDASKMSVVDLKEVYLKEKGNIPLTDISEYQRVCRLCFRLVTSGLVSLNEVDIDIIGTYIPQVNINATRDPVICGPCFHSLRTHGGFVKNCLDAQEKYKSSDKQFYVKTEEIKVKLEEDSQDVPEKFKNIDEQSDIRSEKIEIKLEGEVCDGASSYDNETIKNKKMYTSEDTVEIKGERVFKSEREFIENYNDQIPRSEQSKFEKSGPSLDMQVLSQCGKCKFKTKHKPNVELHQIQKTLSEAGKSKCDTCGFDTKHKSNLKTFQLTHKDTSKIRMYNCDICNYKTKYNSHLKIHHLVHKDSSEIQMYKCDTCTYETKYKGHLKDHLLTHKDPSEIQMNKCDTCGFETKYKSHLKRHRMMHKDSSEIQRFKCNMCSFVTRHKNYLRAHQLVHKGRTEVQMYRCDTCSFETKYKGHLRVHQLIHKDSSEIQMYKCEYCAYESRYNGNLNKHRLIHKDPSEIQMYKCDICNYESKRKKNLKDHRLTHGQTKWEYDTHDYDTVNKL
ncbi:zinc finger protein 90-like [Anoplophora glabripennis]|uniref:zinc finger protein 90-like n=1 Tax=Anoplophora glabripennis TaxID=217634 RepID=UPI000873CCD0|nr:zinc finger protein 90-like [Anoplophora glabripennis]